MHWYKGFIWIFPGFLPVDNRNDSEVEQKGGKQTTKTMNSFGMIVHQMGEIKLKVITSLNLW